jgi:lysophospholipid acyltransferase (LPLAT)-like uncharacterized protein
LRSWDTALIPKPGSRVVVVVGEPIEVPRDADTAMLESRRLDLEEAMRVVEASARDLLL